MSTLAEEADESADESPLDQAEVSGLGLTRSLVRLPWTAAGLGAVFLVPVFAPPFAVEGVAMLTALVVAAVLAVRAFFAPPASRARLIVSAASFLAVTPVAFSFLAVQPSISFVGMVGHHGGAATWLIGALWLSAAALGGSGLGARWVIRVASLGGAGYAIVALLQKYEPRIVDPIGWGNPSAGLGNTLTMAKLMLLALGATAAWWFFTKTRLGRIGAVVCAALCLAGLTVANSSGAWLGLAFGIGMFALLSWPKIASHPRLIAAYGVGMAIVATASTVAATQLHNGFLYKEANVLTNNRFGLWESSITRIMADPLMPHGLGQFSAWVVWHPDPEGGIATQAAYAAHGVMLSAWMGGGLFGLLATLAGAGIVLAILLQVHVDSGYARPVRAIVAALVGWATSLTVSWLSPVPLAVAAALGAVVVVAAYPSAERTRQNVIVHRVASGLVALTAIAAVAMCMKPIITEVEWASQANAKGLPPAAASIKAFNEWPGPSFAYAAALQLRSSLLERDPASIAMMNDIFKRAAPGRRYAVDLALEEAGLTMVLEPDPGKGWARLQRVLADAHRADPATGLWDYFAALEASAWGRPDEARIYARAALARPDTPPDARVILEQIASTESSATP